MRLEWPDCVNARDLGGVATADGAGIRPGALIRSDSHGRLTPATVRAVRERGVSRILDLRGRRECRDDPSPFAGDPVYRNVPLLAEPLAYDPPADSYAPMVDHHGDRIAQAVHLLAAAPPGAVVVHCRSGRDRTGALVALVLAVAGADPEAIAADYACTAGTDAAAMRNTLRHVRERYGGAERYLSGFGVSDDDLAAVRRRLRE